MGIPCDLVSRNDGRVSFGSAVNGDDWKTDEIGREHRVATTGSGKFEKSTGRGVHMTG